MKRIVDYYLQQWKDYEFRKPLLLRGARQIGKTYAVRQLGKTYESFVEINLEKIEAARKIFQHDLYPEKIIEDLMKITGKEIIPGKTLLFLDEIQIVPRTITALRYFYEEMPELHVIATGSLLDFEIEEVGLPVGRLQSFYMRPISFIEYLAAADVSAFNSILDHNNFDALSNHDTYLKHVQTYIMIGGMPEATQKWIDKKNALDVTKSHASILATYRQDFNIYSKKYQIKYVSAIFNHIPYNIGTKFKYETIDGGFRKQDLVPALELLVTAGIATKIFYSAGQGIPLASQRNENDYRVVFIDVGLTQKYLGLDISDWFEHSHPEVINKGSLIEAFVGQEIAAYSQSDMQTDLYYWHKDSPPQAEVDYLITLKYHITPVECKAGKGSTLHSLNYFLDTHLQSNYGIRFSTQNYSVHEKIHSYPLYAIAKVMIEQNQDMYAAVRQLL